MFLLKKYLKMICERFCGLIMDENNQDNNNSQDNIELGIPKKEEMKSPRSTGCKKKPYIAFRYLSRRPAPPPRHDRHQSREDAELPIVRAVRPGGTKKVITFESLLMDEIKVEMDFEDKYQEIEVRLRQLREDECDSNIIQYEQIWRQSQEPPKKVTLDYQACGDYELNVSTIPHNSSQHPYEEEHTHYTTFQQFIMNELINGMGVPPILHAPFNVSSEYLKHPCDPNPNPLPSRSAG